MPKPKTMILIDGKKLSQEILSKVEKEVAALDFQPVFCDVLVGDDSTSVQYVKMKGRMAEKVGIRFHNANFPSSITTEDLVQEIKTLNKMKNMCGIIVQLPLPEHLDRREVLDAIDAHLDVDCLGTLASEKFYNNYEGENDLGYPTALACMALLDTLNLDPVRDREGSQRVSISNGIDLKSPRHGGASKNIVVLGRGDLVGKPVAALLRHRGLTPVVVASQTINKDELLKQADVIISGIGKGKYIKGDMIKDGAVLIDAGTSEVGGGIVGDVDLDSVRDVAGYVSPVPGGVGPVTVAMLLQNVLKVAKKLNE